MGNSYKTTKYPGVKERKGKKGLTYKIIYRNEFGEFQDPILPKGTTLEDAFIYKKQKEHEKYNNNSTTTGDLDLNPKNVRLSDLAILFFEHKRKLAESEMHLDEKDKQHQTLINIKRNESIWRNFWEESDVANVKLNLISENHVLAYLDNQMRSYSQQSCYNALVLARSIYTFAYESSLIPDFFNSPFKIKKEENRKKFKKPKNSNRKLFLNQEQTKEFIEHIRKRAIHKHYAIAMTSLLTGARPNSVLSLRIRDLNFGANLITFYDYKRKMYYDVNFPSKLQEILKKEVNKRKGSGWVFNGKTSEEHLKRIPESISKVMDLLFNKDKDKNDERIVPYSLRHTFANLLIHSKKIQIDRVSRMLNHASVHTTEAHYLSRSVQENQGDIQSLEDMILE